MLIKMSREKVEKCCVDTIICSFMHNNYNRQQSNCCSDRLINTHRHKRTYINAEVLSMLWALLCILCCFYVAACCCCMLLLSVAGAVPRTNHGQQCFHITQKQQTQQHQQRQRKHFHNLTAINVHVECSPRVRLCNTLVQHVLLARRLQNLLEFFLHVFVFNFTCERN